MEDLKQIQEFFSKPLEENIVVRMYNTTDKTADLYKEDNPGLEFYLTGKKGQDYVRKYKDHISFPFSSHMNDGTPIPNYEENKEKLAAYLKQKGIPFKTTSAKPYRGVSRTTGEDFMYTTDTFKVPLSHVDIKDISLNEGKQLDQVDFAKVVKAVEQTGHPVTVLLVPKFNEIEVLTGMDAPDDMLRDLSNAVDALGYGRDDIFIAGDSSNLSRREYSDIRRVNGGHKDYFEESVNEAKTYKKGDKLKIKLKNGKKFDVVFDSYSSNKGIAYGKIDGDRKPFSLDAVVSESVNENLNPEVIKAVNRFIKAMAKRYDYSEQDAVYAIMSALKQEGFQGLNEAKVEVDEASKGALNYFNDLKYYYQKAFRYLDVEEREEYKQLAKDFFSRLQIDDKVRAVGLEENMSLDDQAKAYYLAKVKRGEIDTLPKDPKAAFLAQMMKDQIDHDKETLRRERGLEEKIREIVETIKLGQQLNEELCEKGKRYIKARQAAGEKSSAYLSGRAVRVCKGQIEWPKKGKKK